jgi:hypothetical protein
MIAQDQITPAGEAAPGESAQLERIDALDLYVQTINRNLQAMKRHMAELAEAVARHATILKESE